MVARHEQKRETQCHHRCNNRIDHPKYPSEGRHPRGIPRRDTDEDPHLDDGGKAHGNGAEEEGIVRVLYHDAPDLGIEGVSED